LTVPPGRRQPFRLPLQEFSGFDLHRVSIA
jgi:hypothetical protein